MSFFDLYQSFKNEWIANVGKLEYQGFFDEIYKLSLQGMNFGGGAAVQDSGELNVLKYIRDKFQYVGDHFTVFDVGANVGEYTLFVLQTLGNIRVLSFEPSYETFKQLENKAGGYKNIEIYNIGFGDKNTTLTLYSNQTGSGLASLYKRRLDHFGIDMNNKEEVTIRTIDDFCKERGIEKIHFLKLDVEGHELRVLQGAKEMINANAIEFIQFEFGGCNIDSRTYFQDFYYFLNDKYKIYRIIKDGLYPIDRYDERYEIFVTTNYLAERR
jgi:FkbM family methyltransferase